ASPAFRCFGKGRQPRTESVERKHHRAGQHDAERRQCRRRERPQPNFHRDEIERPNDDNKSDGSAKDDTARLLSVVSLDSYRSDQAFFAHGEFVDAVEARFKSNARTGWYAN